MAGTLRYRDALPVLAAVAVVAFGVAVGLLALGAPEWLAWLTVGAVVAGSALGVGAGLWMRRAARERRPRNQ